MHVSIYPIKVNSRNTRTSSGPQVFFKRGVLKNFVIYLFGNIHRKTLASESLLIKVVGLEVNIYLFKVSNHQ